MTNSLSTIFERSLRQLTTEIASYPDEASLWKTSGNISNSAGNLALHLAGNLQHYIGAVLGNSGYVRNRPAEFSGTDIPKAQLLKEIEETSRVVKETLKRLPESELQAAYPEQVGGLKTNTETVLIHLVAHLGYHLGQINHHRRLVVSE